MTKISQLSDLGANLAAGDEFVVRDVSDVSTPNKKVTASGFIDYVIAQGVGSGFTQISAGATVPASVQCFSSGTTREVIVTTSGVERARFTTAGQLRMAGAGITFNGDTATANELDDYEEGTWTPSQGSGLTVVGAYSSAGVYTKIGDVIHVFAALKGATSIASSGGGILCGGLPFTPVPPLSGFVVGSMMNHAQTQSNTCSAIGSTNVYGTAAVAANVGIYLALTYYV